MEHRMGEPTTELASSGNTLVGRAGQKRTVFDMIENPERGWSTRKIKQIFSTDRPAFWRIELMHDETAAVAQFESESLFVAWARVTEAAHAHNIGLFNRPETQLGTEGPLKNIHP